MRKLITNALVGLSLVLLASQALAGQKDQKQTAVPSSLQSLISHWHLDLIKSFPTDAPGITGYVVKAPNGKTGILYSYKNFVLSGSLINAKGENLTRKYADQEMPKPKYSKDVAALEKLSHVVTEGKEGAPQVYVFADPNCIFCHKFWDETRPWVKAGKIQLHWVLVGFLKSTSAGRAAAIMSSQHPAEALTQNETGFDAKHEEGAIQPMKKVPGELTKAIKAHQHMMAKLQFTGTPALVYQDTDGKWHGMTGVPKMDKFAKELGISN